MRCALNRWRLSRAADQQLDKQGLSAAAVAHTEGCAKCTRFQASLKQLGSSLHAGRASAPAADLSPPRSWALPALPTLAMVSIAAVAIGLFFAFGRDSNTTAGNDKNDLHDTNDTNDTKLVAPAQETNPPFEAPPKQQDQRVAVRDAPVDIEALAGDASGGLKYVLRVSGLQ